MMAAMDLLFDYDREKAENVKELEKEADIYEDRLGSYLVQTSGLSFQMRTAGRFQAATHAIGDFRRISDHAVNVTEAAQELPRKKIVLSEEGRREGRIPHRQ